MTDLIKTLTENVALLEAAALTASGQILGWPGLGIGVRFEGKEPRATGVLHADVIVTAEQAQTMPEEAWAYIPVIVNGAGQRAVLMDHKATLLDAAASCRESLAELKTLIH